MTETRHAALILPFARRFWDPRLSLTRASMATYFDRQGRLRTAAAHTPRLDHDPLTGVCQGLLVEEGRTNLLRHSEDFGDVLWSTQGASVAPSAVPAPDGSASASRLTEDASTVEHQVHQGGLSMTAGTAYVLSVFARPAARRHLSVTITGGVVPAAAVMVDLDAGTATVRNGSPSAFAVAPVGGGWWRVWMRATATVTATTQARLYLADGDTTAYTGDGASGLDIWGAQLEEGDFPTSYIPTAGATATRAADVCLLDGHPFAEVWNPTEGTIVVGFRPQAASGTQVIAHLDDGTNETAHKIYRSPDGRIFLQTNTPTVTGSFVYDDPGAHQRCTTAYAFAAGDFAGTLNGGPVQTDTTRLLPNVHALRLGSAVSIYRFTGHLTHLALYPQRLDNATLQALTA